MGIKVSKQQDNTYNARICKSTGFPFGFAQGGESFDSFDLEALGRFAQDREPVEPRVKPGMTKTAICVFLPITTQSRSPE
jgi:hypothetical protein